MERCSRTGGPGVRRLLTPAALFLAALLPRLYHANSAFTVFADHNTSNWALFARNLLERGWLESRLGLILNIGPGTDGPVYYFSHHPPTLALVTSLGFLVLGAGELASRLPSLVLSAATCPLLFALFRRVLGTSWALLGALLFALAPGAVAYGQSLNPEAFVVFLGAAALWAWCRFDETGGRGWWRLSLALLAAAVLTDWPGSYLAPALLVASAISPRTRPRLLALAAQIAATTAASLALVFTHILVLQSSFEDIMEALRFRVLSSPEKSFTLAQYVATVWKQLEQAVTPSIRWMAIAGLGLTALSLLWRPAPRRAEGGAPPAAVAAALAVSGWLHHLLFTNACYLNPNISYYLVPSLLLLAAACPAIVSREAAGRIGHPAAAGAGLPVALVFVALFTLQAPALFHYHFTKFVSPGWPLVGRIVQRIVPPRGRLLSTVSVSSPQFRHYAWRRMRGGVRRPEAVRGYDEPVYFLRDLNSRLPASAEEALEEHPWRSALNFRIYGLGPDASMPPLPDLARPSSMAWSLEDVRYGDDLHLVLHALDPVAVTVPPAAWWERYLGVPWSLERAAGRVVHASVIWERLDGPSTSLQPRYWLALEGPREMIHAPPAWPLDRQDAELADVPAGSTVRHDVTFFFSEWLPQGSYSLRVGVLAGSRLLPLSDATPPDPQLGPYARLGRVRFRHSP